MLNYLIKPVDTGNHDEVQFICRQHLTIPEIWILNYSFTEQELQEEVQRFKDSDCKGELICLTAKAGEQIIGYIWAEKSVRDRDLVTIMSLWTAPEFRSKGIATALKQELDRVAQKHGFKKIRTSVYAPNQKMLDLNLKLGYQIVRYTLEKKL